MVMDEGMEDIIEEECVSSSDDDDVDDETSSEIDSDYEFDAARFFDFTRTETCSEADDAEEWFRFAPTYPPSPFAVKLNLIKMLSLAEASNSSKLEEAKSIATTVTNTEGTSLENQDIQKARTKSITKPAKVRSTTLMKPTASLLAKQDKSQDAYSSHLSQRLRSPSLKLDVKSSPSLSGSEDLATKRQKLETGFVRKAAHLKHQRLLLHKITTKGGSVGGNSPRSKLKVTVPKEPQFETTQRAERHRFKNSSESSEHAKPKSNAFKARPLNRKILAGPATLPPKKSAPKLTDFQVFNLKTKERAMQHSSSNVSDKNSDEVVLRSRSTSLRSSNSGDVLKKEKCETSPKSKGGPLNKKNLTSKERMVVNQNIRQGATVSTIPRSLSGKRISINPPTELFNKLSIKSAETNTVSQTKVHQPSKVSKENAPNASQLEFWRCMGKPNKCGGGNSIPEIGCHPNMNRSLDIH